MEEQDNCNFEMIHLVTVYPPEDIIIEDILKKEGIRVLKKRESIALVEGLSIGPLAEVKLYVLPEQERKAKEVLNNLRSI